MYNYLHFKCYYIFQNYTETRCQNTLVTQEFIKPTSPSSIPVFKNSLSATRNIIGNIRNTGGQLNGAFSPPASELPNSATADSDQTSFPKTMGSPANVRSTKCSCMLYRVILKRTSTFILFSSINWPFKDSVNYVDLFFKSSNCRLICLMVHQ